MILRGNRKGQSTVEFALTLILLMAVIFFHYATFMSARAYLSAGPDQSDQMNRAKLVIEKTLKQSEILANRDRFPGIAQGVGGSGDPAGFDAGPPAEFVAGQRSSSWMQGVRYTFKSRLFLIPMGGSSANGGSANSLTLTSESWLGRETDEDECQTQMGKVQGIYDNGC
jgi:hypothetical protein